MPIEHLDSAKTFALLSEMTSTRNLLGYGTKVLREAKFIETTRDPIMTMLSIGMEKLLKVTIGVIGLDESKSWPSKETMVSYGHGVVNLYDHVMVQIKIRTAGSSGYVRDLIAVTESDPVLRPLLAALDRYGKSGRFFNLDLLAARPQVDTNPTHMWDEAEQAVLGEPTVVRLREIAIARADDNDAWDAFHREVQGQMADSIERCWEMISRVGINNALGVTGATMGFEIAPGSIGRQ